MKVLARDPKFLVTRSVIPRVNSWDRKFGMGRTLVMATFQAWKLLLPGKLDFFKVDRDAQPSDCFLNLGAHFRSNSITWYEGNCMASSIRCCAHKMLSSLANSAQHSNQIAVHITVHIHHTAGDQFNLRAVHFKYEFDIWQHYMLLVLATGTGAPTVIKVSFGVSIYVSYDFNLARTGSTTGCYHWGASTSKRIKIS